MQLRIVQKTGNSLTVSLPKVMAAHAMIEQGDYVEIRETEQGLLITKAVSRYRAQQIKKLDTKVRREGK